MIQTRCLKCGLPLETKETIDIGFGDTCIKNIETAFNAEMERVKDKEVDSNKLLIAFAALGEESGIGELVVKFAEIKKLSQITFEDIKVIFRARRKLEDRKENELASMAIEIIGEMFPSTLSMAKGEASLGDAVLSFDEESGTICLNATTVRKASELLCKIPDCKRYGFRSWSFSVCDIGIVYAIVSHYWPLVKVLDSFIDASIRFKGVERPKREKEKAFTVEAIDGFSFVYIQMKVRGQFKYKYHTSQEIRSITDSLGFMWIAKKTKRDDKGNESYCYLVEDSKINEFNERMKKFEM